MPSRVLLSTGTMTIDDARRQLNVDKDTIKRWTKNLGDTGIIGMTTPLYGSPRARRDRIYPYFFEISWGLYIPLSVIIFEIYSQGVTSKAGFLALDLSGAILTLLNSLSESIPHI